jgi:hypothetical protein
MKAVVFVFEQTVEDRRGAFVILTLREPMFITLRGPYLPVEEAGEGFRAPREGPKGREERPRLQLD